jgi:hypothetical protein
MRYQNVICICFEFPVSCLDKLDTHIEPTQKTPSSLRVIQKTTKRSCTYRILHIDIPTLTQLQPLLTSTMPQQPAHFPADLLFSWQIRWVAASTTTAFSSARHGFHHRAHKLFGWNFDRLWLELGDTNLGVVIRMIKKCSGESVSRSLVVDQVCDVVMLIVGLVFPVLCGESAESKTS